MSEIEEVQEQMKADMEAMLSMGWMMESNAAMVSATNAAAEADPTHSSGINQTSRPVPNMVGQGEKVLGNTGGPHMVQNKNFFPPYGLPPNYTPPNAMNWRS